MATCDIQRVQNPTHLGSALLLLKYQISCPTRTKRSLRMLIVRGRRRRRYLPARNEMHHLSRLLRSCEIMVQLLHEAVERLLPLLSLEKVDSGKKTVGRGTIRKRRRRKRRKKRKRRR